MDLRTALIEAIYAHPAEDPPRLVFADWLLEQGDPRGELIALQYARRAARPPIAASRREAELLEDGQRTWLEGLDAVCDGVQFERGFLARGVVRADSAALLGTASNPAWSTVETLVVQHRVGTARDTAAAALLPRLRGLRAVRVEGQLGVSGAWIEVLAPMLARLENVTLVLPGLRMRLKRQPFGGPMRLYVQLDRAWFGVAKRATDELFELLDALPPNDIANVEVADPRRHAKLTCRELRQLHALLHRFVRLERVRLPR